MSSQNDTDRARCEEIRAKSGLSMTRFARQAGLDPASYSRFVRGHRELSDLSIRRLARVLEELAPKRAISVQVFLRYRERRRR